MSEALIELTCWVIAVQVHIKHISGVNIFQPDHKIVRSALRFL